MMNRLQFPSLFRQTSGWLLYILLSSMLTGCVSIEAVHDPLYRASAHTSTIIASASASLGGSIRRIEITVTEGRADYCKIRTLNGVAPSAIPCRENASRVIHTCEFPDSPKDAICKYPLDTHPTPLPGSIRDALVHEPSSFHTHPEPKLVTYSAMVETSSGLGISYESTDEITYAAGDYPPGLARPIWWHKEKNLDSKIDIALFPDHLSYGSYDFFLLDVDTVLKGAFLNAGQSFSKLYTQNRNFVNLWAGPFGIFSNGCNGFDPVPQYRNTDIQALIPIVALMDGKALFDRGRNNITCSNIENPGGWAVMDVAVVNNSGRTKAGYEPAHLFIHESGHFVHGFGDEYPGGGNYAKNLCANVFSTKSLCEIAGSNRGMSANTSCERITNGANTIDVWHRVITPPGPLDDLMDNKIQDIDWLTDCRYCVLETFTKCEAGTCFQ
ncbi:MAG: hypothetical protein AAB433_21740 [Nitrospirota bacterium]